MPELSRFRRNVYSSGGEDGVLAEIFRRLNVQHGWFCEFGAWDGKYISNSYHLVKQGWRGVEIEADSTSFAELQRTARQYPRQIVAVEARVEEVGDQSLDSILGRTEMPREFHLLSIDIDGPDYQVWRGFQHYSPWVVVIEVLRTLGPRTERIYSDWPGGSSFQSTLELGRSKGYTLVCHTLDNMVFVRDDLAAALRLPPRDLENPYSLFSRDGLRDQRFLPRQWRRVRWLSWQRLGLKLERVAHNMLSKLGALGLGRGVYVATLAALLTNAATA
jgi:hypothetical protein